MIDRTTFKEHLALERRSITEIATGLSAAAVERHQSSGSCSKKPGCGFDRAMDARPSATGFPCRSHAIALVAEVELSMPTTRSGVIQPSNAKREAAGRLPPGRQEKVS